MSIKRTIITTVVALALVAVVAPAVTQAVTIDELMAQIATLQAQLQTLQGTPAATTGTGACTGVTFTRTLVVGSTGSDVKCLQTILNLSATTKVAVTGAGAPGYETTYFGPKTLVAVRVYQAEHGWTPANQVGPMTRAALNAQLGSVPGTPGTPPVVVGPVSAALAVDNPAAGVLVVNQGLATLAKFQLSGTGTITSVTLKRIGVSADSTLKDVYLFDGATRLTDSASVSGGSLITFSGLNIPVSGSKVISVKSTIAGTSGETVGVQLTAATLTSGVVGGALPISGNYFSLSSATLAAVSVGTPIPSSPTTTDPQKDVRVWESTVNVGNRDVTITRLALRQIGSVASSDVNNFRLLIDGVQVAQVQSLDVDKYVTFAFTKTLTTGNRNVKVLADVVGGSSFTIQMNLKNSSDIELTDSQYGVSVLATFATVGSASTITVNPGTMTVEKTSDSPTGNVTNAATDVPLARYKFTANGEPIKVETLIVKFATTHTVTLRNGRIMVNGSQVGSTTTLVTTGTTFSTNFTVTPGSPAIVEVKADIYDNDGTPSIVNTDTITVTMGAGTSNGEKKVSSGYINVPGTDVPASQVTVAQGTMALAKQSNYANQNTVVPQTAYKLASYNLTGSNVEDVNVYTISADFTPVTGTTFSAADLSNVYIKYGNSQTTAKTTVAATDNSWSVSFTLAKNATMPVEVYATIGSTITPSDSIKAVVLVSGQTASSSTAVNTGTQDGQTITYIAGSITAATDASSAVKQIVADNQTISAAAFKFTAVNDTYNLTQLTFSTTATGATAINYIVLKDGNTEIARLPGATTAVFNLPTSGTGSVNVNTSAPKVLTVALELGTVGALSGTSGGDLTVTLDSGKAIPTSTGVEGAISGTSVSGSTLYAYASIPTITNMTLPSGVLSGGGATSTIAKIQVNTSGMGTVSWKKIILSVSKTANPTIADSGAVTLWDGDSNTQISCSTEAASGLTGGAGSGTVTFVTSNEQEVSGAKTYYVKAAIGGSPTSGDSVNTSIAQPSTYVAPTDYTTVAGTSASFVWSDESATSHTTSTSDWNNGFLVKNLPTDSQTLAK